MKRWKLGAAILLLVLILSQPQAAVNGAQQAMHTWVHSVAPALFPFLAMLPVLTGTEACEVYRKLFSKIMKGAFRLPGQAAPAVIIGMICGSPGGALGVKRIAAQSGMSRSDACRVALAVSGLSPAYLILGVGQGLYGSAKLGLKLALIQAIIQIVMLNLLRGAFDRKEGSIAIPPEAENRNPIPAAVETVLCVCGYMVLFSAASFAAARWLGKNAGRLLLLAADLPSGMAELANWNLPGRMFLLGGAVGFSGMCIAAQNMDALRGIGINAGEYLAVKIIMAALFSAAAGMILPHSGAGIPLAANISRNSYAFSMLAAILCAVPVLKSFSNTFFLNKGKSGKKPSETAEYINM